MRHRHAVAGALILNIPMLVAAAYLPAAATATMAVCLAALGAALGTLAGWGIEQQRAARGAESAMPAERSALRRGRVERPGSGGRRGCVDPGPEVHGQRLGHG